jgi:hypothetical protein
VLGSPAECILRERLSVGVVRGAGPCSVLAVLRVVLIISLLSLLELILSSSTTAC